MALEQHLKETCFIEIQRLKNGAGEEAGSRGGNGFKREALDEISMSIGLLTSRKMYDKSNWYRYHRSLASWSIRQLDLDVCQIELK